MADAPQTSKNPKRRAADQRQREARLKWGVTAGVAVVAVTVLAGAYWWYQEREPARDGAPNWSPDSRSIVFSAEVGTGKGDIYLMRADGSGREQITETPDVNESSPAMSPDGQSIAFEADRDGNVDIFVVDRRGGNLRRLTQDKAEDRAPAWSPDGTRIAFMSDRQDRASADLYVMQADGSKVQRLTTDLANWAPQFAPDGQRLAFQLNADVAVLDLATRAVQRLTFAPQNGMGPTWSADGRRIAFVTTRHDKRAEIWTMNADGSDAKVLVSMPSGFAIDPRWSPDGRFIAFVLVPENASPENAGSAQAIYTVELASGTLTRLSR